MIVTVKLFALAKQIVGQDQVEVAVPSGATVGLLRAALLVAHPQLSDLLRHAMFAVDKEYATDATPLPENSEVACIPPVSGG